MTNEDIIDEIDWLLSEIGPGFKKTSDHVLSLTELGINHKQLSTDIINELKARREELL